MTNALTEKPSPATVVENVVLKGDLSGLSPEERTVYYTEVCRSVGLNPLTRPLEYLNLGGRLVLYARKDATDQLRKLHQVSITITARDRSADLYVVTARATLPDGRSDESIGAVSISGLRGDALANALMKAETKAKRRATLSVCGLGMLEKTEVETIPTPTSKPKRPLATTGAELLANIAATEPKLIAAGHCQQGELLAHIIREGGKLGHQGAVKDWPEAAIRWANSEIRGLIEHWKTQKQQLEDLRRNWHPGAAELEALYTELARVKRAWGYVKARLGLDPALKEQDLTAEQYERVMKALHEEPARD